MYLVYDGKESLDYATNESLMTNSAIFRYKYDGIAVRGLFDKVTDTFILERRYFQMSGDEMALLEPVTGGIFLTGRCNSFSDFYYSKGTAHPDIAIKMREVNDKIEFCNNDDGDSDGPECDDAQAARALAELKILIVQICKEAQ